MLISDFIKNSNVINKFGSTLPIPYIENVNVNDYGLEVTLATYVHIPADVYEKRATSNISFSTALSEFFDTLSGYNICLATVLDRDTDTTSFGAAFDVENQRVVDRFPINGWTDVSSGKLSPLGFVVGGTSHPDLPVVLTTKFILPDLKSKMQEMVDSDGITALHEKFENMFRSMLLDDIGGSSYSAGAEEDNILELAAELADRGEYDSENEAIIAIYDILIRKVVDINDYELIYKLFNVITYSLRDHVIGTSTGIALNAVFQDIDITRVRINPLIYTTSLSDLILPVAAEADAITNLADIFENEDGSAYVKVTTTRNVHTTLLSDNIFGFNYNENVNVKNLGLISFTAPEELVDRDSDIKENIIEDYEKNNGANKFWENSISGVNYLHFIKNNQINFDPVEVYVDENGVIYDEAMQSIDGNYYDVSNVTPEVIIADMQAIDLSGVSAETKGSFEYLLASSLSNKTQIIPQINLFRRSFPDKSTATPEGIFYDRFTEILYNANTVLQRGTKLTKSLRDNPIVKDLRSYRVGGSGRPAVHTSAKAEYYDIFNMDYALWSRYTEVTGKDSDYTASEIIEEDVTLTTEIPANEIVVSETHSYTVKGGEWNYNFIDHGFLFFNYEKALKKTSFFSRYLYVPIFEKYFGQKIANDLFRMKKIHVDAFYSDDPANLTSYPIGGMSADIDIGIPMKVKYYKIDPEQTGVIVGAAYTPTGGQFFGHVVNIQKFDVFVNNSVANATAENGYTDTGNGTRISNDYGGADAMTKSTEYSFIAQRGFVPISNSQVAEPFKVGTRILSDENINYRLACFEVQKCDKWEGYEFSRGTVNTTGLLQEIIELNRGVSFKSSILVEDRTHTIFTYLLSLITQSYNDFVDYGEAAGDTCSFNEETGTFNQFFVTTMETNFPNAWDSPYYKAVSYTLMLEDIFFNTMGGDELKLTDAIKTTFQAVSPQTGTLSGISTLLARMENLLDTLDDLNYEFKEEANLQVGHIYGHNAAYYGVYNDAVSDFEEEYGKIQGIVKQQPYALEGEDQWSLTWVPDSGYDNYPMFPSSYVSTEIEETTTTPVVEEQTGTVGEGAADVRIGLTEGVVEGIREDIELQNKIDEVAAHIMDDFIAKMDTRFDFSRPITVQDVLDMFFVDVTVFFPAAEMAVMTGVGLEDITSSGFTHSEIHDIGMYFDEAAVAFGDLMNGLHETYARAGSLMGTGYERLGSAIAALNVTTGMASTYIASAAYMASAYSYSTSGTRSSITSMADARTTSRASTAAVTTGYIR